MKTTNEKQTTWMAYFWKNEWDNTYSDDEHGFIEISCTRGDEHFSRRISGEDCEAWAIEAIRNDFPTPKARKSHPVGEPDEEFDRDLKRAREDWEKNQEMLCV
jgi:hypothetical protein